MNKETRKLLRKAAEQNQRAVHLAGLQFKEMGKIAKKAQGSLINLRINLRSKQ